MKNRIIQLLLSGMLSLAFANSQATQVNITTYGAIANDAINDRTAIQNAINAAGVGDTIIFPFGTYNLSGTGNKLNLKSNITLDGKGSTLACDTWSIIFGNYSTTNVTVKNFIINWDNDLPFSGGTVIAKGASYVDVQVRGNHSVRVGKTIAALMEYDTTEFRPATGGFDIYQTNATLTTSPSAGVMRCPVVAGSIGSINVGDNVVVRFQVYTGDFFSTIGASNVTLSDITIYNEPGMILYSRSVTNLTLRNINVLRKPGFWMTATADGFHFNNDRGAISVSNCTPEAMGDDGINVHSIYTKITGLTSNTMNIVDSNTGNIPYPDEDPKVGDSLEVTDPATMIVIKKLYVQAVVRNGTYTTITTTSAIPGTVLVNHFVANAGSLPTVNITGTTIQNNRARGILMQNRHANITGCSLIKNSWSGILLETTAAFFFEAISPANITISNCLISNGNYWVGYNGAIALRALNNAAGTAAAGILNNISILDNTFVGSYNSTDNRAAISIESANNVVIRGNTFDAGYANQNLYVSNTGYNLYVNAANSHAWSTPKTKAVKLPGVIYAENVDRGGQTIAYFERSMPSPNPSPTNDLIQTASAAGVATYVNTIEKNEWLQYSINVPSNLSYQIKINCGSSSSGGARFHLEANHVNLTGILQVGNTGSAFTVVNLSNVKLPGGTYPIRLVVDSGTFFVDTIGIRNSPAQTIGAIRWDAWTGSGNAVGTQIEQTLGPLQYHYRVPFYGVENSSTSVTINACTQSIMDQEIRYAAQAGLDYWAFLWYPASGGLDQSRKLYKSSSLKNSINYCLIIEASNWVTNISVDSIVNDFKSPNYQKVLGNRPLLYLLGYSGILKKDVDTLRARTIRNGLQTPYIVEMRVDGVMTTVSTLGLDAFSLYATSWIGGGVPYDSLANTDIVQWNYTGVSLNIPTVPHVTTGWDKRPRHDHNVTWEADPGASAWVQQATVSELTYHVNEAKNWNYSHPTTGAANTVIIFAWNEFDEGGWLCPTLSNYGGTQRVAAFGGAFGGRITPP